MAQSPPQTMRTNHGLASHQILAYNKLHKQGGDNYTFTSLIDGFYTNTLQHNFTCIINTSFAHTTRPPHPQNPGTTTHYSYMQVTQPNPRGHIHTLNAKFNELTNNNTSTLTNILTST